ncbi:MAG: hypothetical protein ACI4S3_07485 [Candidatus Gastranaerophilaceae bacterium]
MNIEKRIAENDLNILVDSTKYDLGQNTQANASVKTTSSSLSVSPDKRWT